MLRDYENTPRPLVESHPHIRMLFEAQDKRANERTAHRDKEKAKSEREELIQEAKVVVLTDFWCEECQEDFKAVAIKEVEVDWSNTSQRIAFYRTTCDKGHWCQRLITDRHMDSFWSRSKEMEYDRAKHVNDMIQPHETGFELLYGKKNKQ